MGPSHYGGDDAPPSKRGRIIYRSVVALLVFGIVCVLAYGAVR